MLPHRISLLCIHGVVVLPQTILPLPISLKQYDLLKEVTKDTDGILGIVQPSFLDFDKKITSKLPLFELGTAVSLAESEPQEDDDGIVVYFKGICRFKILHEIPGSKKLRQAIVSYQRYIEADAADQKLSEYDKASFLTLARLYMTQLGVNTNWKELSKAPDSDLINFLTMAGPFEAAEKQAILEKINPDERKDLLKTIMDMSLSDTFHTSSYIH